MNSLLARPSSRELLARILEERALVAEVRALPPAALAKLIEHVGLEDAGEIIELATTEQIERIFDEDLWRTAVLGEDETFDAARFVLWLEILLEAGELACGRRLAALPADVITLAFHRLVAVVDIDELHAEIADRCDDDRDEVEDALESALSHEIGSHIVVARQHDGWDAIVAALVALDEVDHPACVRVLERCGAMTSRDRAECGGLGELLSDEAMLEIDVAAVRADRRAAEGFVAPSDAKSFLALARQTPARDIVREQRDVVTRAWFRELERGPVAPAREAAPRLLALLESAGILREEASATVPRRRLPSRGRGSSSSDALADALARLATTSPPLHAERMEELAFLVNVLLSGASLGDRPFRSGEAAEAVLVVVRAGLAEVTAKRRRSVAEVVTADGVVSAFRLGIRRGALERFVSEMHCRP